MSNFMPPVSTVGLRNMSNSVQPHQGFTDEEKLRLWATYIKRWGELIHDSMLADAERCATLDTFDQTYLRAYWQGVARKVRRIATEPQSVPTKTKKELDLAWRTIRLELGFPITDDIAATDVQKRLEFFKRKIAHEFERSVVDTIDRHKVTSPIEQIFLIQWKYQKVELQHGLALLPQAPVTTGRGAYAVDFLVSKINGQSARIAIELDGHAFHEKSSAQATKDKARERAILTSGIPVFRFSGSEIFNNPRKVVDEVVDYFTAKAA
jgi:very-short-patch-repair endonuclease